MAALVLDQRDAQRLVNYLVRQQAEQAELAALIDLLVQAPAAAPPAEPMDSVEREIAAAEAAERAPSP